MTPEQIADSIEEALLSLRTSFATNIKRSATEWAAYDTAVLDCIAAVRAILKEKM